MQKKFLCSKSLRVLSITILVLLAIFFSFWSYLWADAKKHPRTLSIEIIHFYYEGKQLSKVPITLSYSEDVLSSEPTSITKYPDSSGKVTFSNIDSNKVRYEIDGSKLRCKSEEGTIVLYKPVIEKTIWLDPIPLSGL